MDAGTQQNQEQNKMGGMPPPNPPEFDDTTIDFKREETLLSAGVIPKISNDVQKSVRILTLPEFQSASAKAVINPAAEHVKAPVREMPTVQEGLAREIEEKPLENEPAQSKTTISVAGKGASGVIENTIAETDITEMGNAEAQPKSAEELFAKEKLGPADAMKLYDLLYARINQTELGEFIWKICLEKAKTEQGEYDPILLENAKRDYEIFRANPQEWSPDLIQSVLVVGGIHEKSVDEQDGSEAVISIYNGMPFRQGGLNMVVQAYYARGQDLKLRQALVKVALDKEDSKKAFEEELHIAKKCRQITVKHRDDPRIKNLLIPIHCSRDMIVMPYLKDADGRSRSAFDVIKGPAASTGEWAGYLAGAMKGANLAMENGLIDVDLKLGNIVVTDAGGVLIDWGGFMDKDDVKKGKITFFDNPVHGQFPHLNRGEESLDKIRIEKNLGNSQRTPDYISLNLVAGELKGEIPPGSCHKFSLYRILERFFMAKKHSNRDLMGFIKLSEKEKLKYPALKLKRKELNAGELLLYELYIKLHKAHHHPYRFKNNNYKKGLDPQYISTEEIVARLEEIAQLT